MKVCHLLSKLLIKKREFSLGSATTESQSPCLVNILYSTRNTPITIVTISYIL